eukprot:828753-Amphidinium_carterae.1
MKLMCFATSSDDFGASTLKVKNSLSVDTSVGPPCLSASHPWQPGMQLRRVTYCANYGAVGLKWSSGS